MISTMAALASLTAGAQAQQPMKLWYNQEARFFEESLPIGNGKLGALVYGGAEDNLIYLNDIGCRTVGLDSQDSRGAVP